MTRKTVVAMAILVLTFSVACSPGLVDEDCASLDKYSSSTWLTKAFCKLGNLL